LRKYWDGAARIYGDLDFNNILCDPPASTVCFIDPGMPEKAYECSAMPRRWYPASRDLAYVLYDVATSVRSVVGRPRVRRRRRMLIESMLRQFAGPLASDEQRQSLLAEIHACCSVHLGRINVSWSPAGIGRRAVRRAAERMIGRMLHRLGA
jgi:hypothetical protein